MPQLFTVTGPAQEGFWLRVPRSTVPPTPAQLAQDPRCRCSCPWPAGSALGVVPVLGAGVTWAQACGTRQASVSLGGTLAWRSCPLWSTLKAEWAPHLPNPGLRASPARKAWLPTPRHRPRPREASRPKGSGSQKQLRKQTGNKL